jgi:nucleoside-diphosphate-sugar epimerase
LKILLTGGTGFTGAHVLSQLRERGLDARCLVRKTSDRSRLNGAEMVEGDLGDAASLDRAMHGMDVLLNTASIGFGHGPMIVEAAKRAGIRRVIFISTTAVFTTLNAATKTIRLAAEQAIQESSLDWTILRPTMIYGTPLDRNMVRLIRYLRRWRVLPVVGDGESLQQPVYVGDVAGAVLQSLDAPGSIGRAYNISGAAPLTFNEVVDTIGEEMRRKVWKVHVPAGPPIKVLQAIERMGVHLPVRAEQFLRLNENKAFDYGEAARDLGYAPISFREGIRRELREMGL